jgi:DNA invertase Pin-like site-specific DNA recombinase
MPKPKRAALYLRVSTDGQTTDKSGWLWRPSQLTAGGP